MTQRIEPLRFDYAFPLRIGPSARQAQLATYPDHVAQMIRQVLLTGPGERINMPEFGCGLRQLVFEPKTAALSATTEMMVRRALETTLGGHIVVNAVTVGEPASMGDGAIQIEIAYTLIETRTAERLMLEVR